MGVLERKFGWPPARVAEVEGEIRHLAEIADIRSSLNTVTQDSADNRILECAVDGNAGVIISGDSRLTSLFALGEVEILTPREFADLHRPTAP